MRSADTTQVGAAPFRNLHGMDLLRAVVTSQKQPGVAATSPGTGALMGSFRCLHVASTIMTTALVKSCTTEHPYK